MKWMMSALVLALGGCSTTSVEAEPPPLLTVDDVIRMHEAGEAPATMVARVQASRLPVPLSDDDVVRLKDHRVPDEVVRAMGAAPTPVVERSLDVAPTFSYHDDGYHQAYPYRYGWHPRSPRYNGYPHYRARNYSINR